jgi:hypothetical protein
MSFFVTINVEINKRMRRNPTSFVCKLSDYINVFNLSYVDYVFFETATLINDISFMFKILRTSFFFNNLVVIDEDNTPLENKTRKKNIFKKIEKNYHYLLLNPKNI